jgi:hypothetical protein
LLDLAWGLDVEALALLDEAPDVFKLDFSGFFCLRCAIREDSTKDLEDPDIFVDAVSMPSRKSSSELNQDRLTSCYICDVCYGCSNANHVESPRETLNFGIESVPEANAAQIT